MLQKILVQNYALIDAVEINFADKLTIITGETGAGKSILLGALSLILGERAESNVLYDKQKKCVVEGHFTLKKKTFSHFFEEEQLDFDEHTIVRREISTNGKSRAFINDTPVNLNVLKSLCNQLVDLHSQSESLELNSASFQLTVVDSLAKHDEVLNLFSKNFHQFNSDKKKLEILTEENLKASREFDYLNFQLKELIEADLIVGEQEKTEQELELQNNSEEIKRNLIDANNLLSGNAESVTEQLRKLNNFLSAASKNLPDAEELIKRIQSAKIELDDVSNELERLENKVQFNPQQIENLNTRLDLIYRLEKKHGLNSVEELKNLQNEIDGKLQSFTSQHEEIEALKSSVEKQKENLFGEAKKISASRAKQISPIEKSVTTVLKEVGMPHAQIKVEQTVLTVAEMNENGIDRFRFLFAANKGSELQEIKKVASGGELSRLMLALKSLIAANTHLPTLIFDEIDSGISGETALKVSRIMKQLSGNHQLICITHLPQIAAKGNEHYFVFKETIGSRTFTRIKQLSNSERINAVAQMLSGEKPTQAAMENAKELMEN